MHHARTMLLSMMASWGLAADVATLPPPIPQPQAPAALPSGLTFGATDTTCEFTTILPPGSNRVQVVHLEEVAVDGSLIALRGIMRDDGIAVIVTAPHVVGAEVHGVTRVNEASVPGATPAGKPTRK